MQSFLNSWPLNLKFSGNTLLDWGAATLLLVAIYFLLTALRSLLGRRLRLLGEKTRFETLQLGGDLIRRTNRLVIFFCALYAAALTLKLPASGRTLVHHAFVIALLLQAGFWGSELAAFGIRRLFRQASQDPEKSAATGLLELLARGGVWAVVLLLMLENTGIDVTALVAGLGIGGVAVALAVQNILGDLLASLSIILDKPIVVGDFIVLGDFQGTVEKIGIKSTRLKALSGEQLILSNSDLLSSRIRNYKRMFERRILFTIGVTYKAPREKLEALPGQLRDIIAATPRARFERAHLKQFGAYSIDFEIVYFVLSPEIPVYMDTQQEINLKIHALLEAQGLEFAFPTQTLVIEGDAQLPGQFQKEDK